MSRRKQTNPFKVNWPFHTSGITGLQHTINMEGRDEFLKDSECHSNNSHALEEQDSISGPFHTSGITGLQHTINMEGRDEFVEDSECHSNNSHALEEQDSISEDSDSDPDIHGDDSSSNTSADDHMTTKRTQWRLQGAGVKEESEEGADRRNNFVRPLRTLDFSSPEKLISHVYQESEEGADRRNNFVRPLRTLDFSSPEKLISHVYQHSAMMSNNKSYVCPVCGRALSSPGSLGRHLLIHSEDRLSNCAVCGTHFTDTNNFNREKLKEVLNTSSMECTSGRDTCSMSQPLSSSPMSNPGPGPHSCQGPGPGPSPCHGPRSCQGPGPSPCHGPRPCQGPGPVSSPCQGPRSCHGHGQGPGPCSGPCAGSGQGQVFPSLPDSLLSGGPSLPSIPDALGSSSSSGLPSLPDRLSPMPVYPAGVLLVCNSCVAYQQLVEAQSPLRKWALRRKNEPLDARMQRLERERTAKKSKRACESEEEREIRRLRDREAKRMQRLQETEEQRARRLQRDREAMRMKRANETPEKRQRRLIREREAKRIKRRLEKIDPSLRTQIEHDPAAMAALTVDMSLFQFPCPMPVPPLDNGLFMKLPEEGQAIRGNKLSSGSDDLSTLPQPPDIGLSQHSAHP